MKGIFCAFVVIFFAACAPLHADQKPPEIKDFAGCVAAGNPVLKTFPPRCMTRDGKVFTHEETKKIGGRTCRDQCGDGVCQPGESEATCFADCGQALASETRCGDGIDGDRGSRATRGIAR